MTQAPSPTRAHTLPYVPRTREPAQSPSTNE